MHAVGRDNDGPKRVAGTPQHLDISGTPTTTLSDLNALLLAATHQYYEARVAYGSVRLTDDIFATFKPRSSTALKATAARLHSQIDNTDLERIGRNTFRNVQQ